MQFVDFWRGFKNENHWFIGKFLDKSKNGTVYSVHGANPDTEGGAYGFPEPRVFFSAEPDHTNPHKERLKSADYSFSYHYGDGRSNPKLKNHFPEKHLRILNFVASHGPQKVRNEIKRKNKNEEVKAEEGKAASMVYSNSKEHRKKIFDGLSQKLRIDSAGPYLNNMENNWTVPKGRHALINFMSGYKFYLAVENSRHRGYLTEKLYNALLADTIPVYWGDPDASEVFNSEAFLDFSNYSSLAELADKLIGMSQNEEEEILNAPIADVNNKMFDPKRVKSRIKEI